MKPASYRLYKVKSFWLALFLPILGLAAAAVMVFSFTEPNNLSIVMMAAFVFMIVVVVTPAVVLVLLNERNRVALEHNQILRQKLDFERHYHHVDQFSRHINPELLKRLGVAPRVLHQLSFPATRDGEFSLNDSVYEFIHHSFAQISQAAQVIEKLYASLDEDEQVVAQNRLEFVINQSVYLMYFIAKKVKGEAPQCKDFYFLKDALADYYDLIMSVVDFDGRSEHCYDLAAFNQVFVDKSIKTWFIRNQMFLQQACTLASSANPLEDDYQKWT